MRWMTSSLAMLLSLFMVATPISASACDMICWLQQAHSDCHAASSKSAAEEGMAMPMSPDMDMGSDRGESAIENDRSAALDHSMPSDMDMSSEHDELTVRLSAGVRSVSDDSKFMPSEMRIPVARFEDLPKGETGTNASPDSSKVVSPCADEACSQIWASASPSRGDHSQTVPLHRIAIEILTSLDSPVSLHRIRAGKAPPEPLASNRLITTLRI
jgi:hypothetical protein